MPTAEMTQEVTSVFQAAKLLPAKIREQLAEELWDSLDLEVPCETAELETMQREELRRRVEDYRSGLEPTYSVDEVREFLRADRTK